MSHQVRWKWLFFVVAIVLGLPAVSSLYDFCTIAKEGNKEAYF
jgi:hypothetical protein